MVTTKWMQKKIKNEKSDRRLFQETPNLFQEKQEQGRQKEKVNQPKVYGSVLVRSLHEVVVQ